MKKFPKIALIGNPNAGKSSLFNSLTGLRQKTGNFPGVTMDKLIGKWKIEAGDDAQIIDLPGIYSIYPKTMDEQVVINILANPDHVDFPDLAIVVVDASNLKRNLLLFAQVRDLGIPTVLALNMIDSAENQGIVVNSLKLAKELNVEVCEINAKKGIGLNGLRLSVNKTLATLYNSNDGLPFEYNTEIVEQVKTKYPTITDYHALLWLAEHDNLKQFNNTEKVFFDKIIKQNNWDSQKSQAKETIDRYKELSEIVDHCLHKTPVQESPIHTWTDKLDKIFLHPVGGYIIFLGILFILFQSIFTWSSLPMSLIDNGIAEFNVFLKDILPPSKLTSLLTDGLIAGIGGVLIFVPQIVFLFFFIALLEETGYMSRVMFIMDKLMRRFGLNGKSVVPLISGMACAVPAIMSTRSIDSRKDRLITIMVTPLMSCSARLPIYTVLIALVVPENSHTFGFFNLQGLALFGMYLLGFFMALASAWVMKMLLKVKERSYFIMELPSYKSPKLSHIALSIFNSTKAFVLDAGKIIIAVSILLWVMASYGPKDAMKNAEVKVRQENPQLSGIQLENKIAAQKLENSYAGVFGKTLEPLIKPLGYDWKIGIALITSFAAREVFVGTMSTIYSLGSENDNENTTVMQRMRSEINPKTGKPLYDTALGFSLLIFYAFAMQCMSTLAVTFRETKSWKYPFLQFTYMTTLAYLSALLVYQMLK